MQFFAQHSIVTMPGRVQQGHCPLKALHQHLVAAMQFRMQLAIEMHECVVRTAQGDFHPAQAVDGKRPVG